MRIAQKLRWIGNIESQKKMWHRFILIARENDVARKSEEKIMALNQIAEISSDETLTTRTRTVSKNQ